MSPEEVARLIRAGLPGAQVRVQSDDHTHFQARVVAQEFSGKMPLARHQLVYRALGELMGREIHALSIEALTPVLLQINARYHTRASIRLTNIDIG